MNPFTGGCHHSDGCLLFQKNCKPCFQLAGTIDDNFAGEMLQMKEIGLEERPDNSMQIITPSHWLGDLSSSSKLFKRFAHHVIPNAFDPNQFKLIPRSDAREKLNVANDKKVLFVNAHHIDNHRKGLTYLLEALERLPKQDYLLMAAGHTLRSEIFPNLHHLGYMKTTEELSLAYSAADLLVLPSLAENLPNTICESLMCGTPVVAFDTGGIKELVNENNGILVPLKDSVALAEAVEKVATKKWNRDLIRDEAIKQFGHLKVATDYLVLYEKIIK
jgi:glycosyltransferase involved in cell wall biosynthesis